MGLHGKLSVFASGVADEDVEFPPEIEVPGKVAIGIYEPWASTDGKQNARSLEFIAVRMEITTCEYPVTAFAAPDLRFNNNRLTVDGGTGQYTFILDGINPARLSLAKVDPDTYGKLRARDGGLLEYVKKYGVAEQLLSLD